MLHHGQIDNGELEEFIRDELASRYRIKEIVYDPRYFASEARNLAQTGFLIAPLQQDQPAAREGWDAFHHSAVVNRMVRHNGDPVLAAHATRAHGVLKEGWRVSKLDQRKPIDALAAVVFAHARVTVGAITSIYETRPLLTIGGGF